MISDKIKYVPILKWKRAEQNALKDMTDTRKDVMMPLIELVMPKPKKATAEEYHDAALELLTSDKIKDYVDTIEKTWDKRPFFIDFTWIYDECRTKVAREAIDTAVLGGLSIIPAVNMSDSEALKNTILEKRNEYDLDIALRISSLDLDDIKELNRRLSVYMSLPHSKADRTHLIVDLKDIADQSEYLKKALAAQDIILLDDWKRLVLASGAFPVDLSECSREDPTILPRNDWLLWNKFINSQPSRIPIFADYGIRHPIYFESHLVLHPTTSIRYTLESGWRIFKGRQKKFGEYLANAAILVTLPEYYSKEYSAGDQYINERADHYPDWSRVKAEEEKQEKNGEAVGKSKAKGTGSTESWLNAGFNHHMSVVADQVSS